MKLKALACVCGFAAVLMTSISGMAEIGFAGVNLAGAEFGDANLPGIYNTHYRYPNQQEVDYFGGRGMNVVRLPFRWERLQRSLDAPLDATEFGGANRFHAFVSQTTAKGVHVVLDPHNYARYHGDLIGSAAVPHASFSNFWWRVADIYRTNDHVIFGLMNEPNNMATETWRDAAQWAINGIRAAGATNLILVPGNAWTGAHSWLQNWYGTPNGQVMLGIVDPIHHFAFEVHQYLDSDSSGTSSSIVRETIGAERLAAFTQWCRSNNRRGFLGEFAVANSTVGSGIGDEAINQMLSYIRTNSDVWLGWTWWAAGPWWGEYQFTLEPTGNFAVDRPAMAPLRDFLPVPVPVLELTGASQFRFPTKPGFLYQPQSSTNLASGLWIDYGSESPGNGQFMTVTMPETDAAHFSRLRVRLAP